MSILGRPGAGGGKGWGLLLAVAIAAIGVLSAFPIMGTAPMPISAPPVQHAFGIVSFSVRFSESGLPNGTGWSVALRSAGNAPLEVYASKVANLSATLPVGNYSLAVSANTSGYGVPGLPSMLRVTGPNLTVNLSFQAVYPMSFQQFGLPPNTAWVVQVWFGAYYLNESVLGPNTTVFTTGHDFRYNVTSTGYLATPPGGNGTHAANKSFVIRFQLAPPALYDGIIAGIVNVGDLATVYIAGVPRSVHPGGTFAVLIAAGTYPVLVEAPGYDSYFGPTTLASNTTDNLAIFLLPTAGLNSSANVTGGSGASYSDGLWMGGVLGGAVAGVAASVLWWKARRPPTLGL